MPLNEQALSQLIIANYGQLNSGDSAVDSQQQEGVKQLADAVAKSVVTALTTQAQVMIPSGAVVVAGSPTTQTNPAPVLGTIL